MSSSTCRRRRLRDVCDITLHTRISGFELRFTNGDQEFVVELDDHMVDPLAWRLHEHLKRRTNELESYYDSMKGVNL